MQIPWLLGRKIEILELWCTSIQQIVAGMQAVYLKRPHLGPRIASVPLWYVVISTS